MSLRTWMVAVAAALLPLGLLSPSHAVSDPMLGAPSVGQCYNVTWSQAQKFSAPKPVVPCTARHTQWIYQVGQAPAGLDLHKTSDYFKAYDKVCTPRSFSTFMGGLGRDYAFSAFARGYGFVPSKAEISQGARWISCEMWLFGSHGHFATTKIKNPKVSKNMPDRLLMCASKAHWSSCAGPHTNRITDLVSVHRTNHTKTDRNAAVRACQRLMPAHANWFFQVRIDRPSSYVVACFGPDRH